MARVIGFLGLAGRRRECSQCTGAALQFCKNNLLWLDMASTCGAMRKALLQSVLVALHKSIVCWHPTQPHPTHQVYASQAV